MRRIAKHLRGNLRIPDAMNNPFVCIAAYYLLQCNIMISGVATIIGGAKQKGPPETGGPEVSRKCGCYSAATFRGGSSAPEKWISPTRESVKPRNCRRDFAGG